MTTRHQRKAFAVLARANMIETNPSEENILKASEYILELADAIKIEQQLQEEQKIVHSSLTIPPDETIVATRYHK